MRGALGLCVLSGLSALMLGACVGAPEVGVDEPGQDNSLQADVAPTGKGLVSLSADPSLSAPAGSGVGELSVDVDDANPIGAAKPTGGGKPVAGIPYHNGPVMTGTINAYIIWYGNWSGNTGTTIIPSFLSNIGGSPYFNINTSYYNSANTHVSGAVTLAGQTTVAYPYGTALTDANIQTIVSNAITSAALPSDTNGVYFVLTSTDVNATSGFCTQYCGWHTHGTIGGKDIKYSFVGNADRCISGCAAQNNGPNGNGGVDGMVSVIAHELEEAASDPDLNAWYDQQGAENADKCAWTFGTTSTASNGTAYNVTLGGKQYLIQRNWSATTQACGMQ